MYSSFPEISRGDFIEETILFDAEDTAWFRQLNERYPHKAGERGILDPSCYSSDPDQVQVRSIVDPQHLAGTVLYFASRCFDGIQATPVQQEVIFLEQVHIGEHIHVHVEFIDVDEKRGWVTYAVKCFNESRNQVMRGQMVLSYMNLL